MEETKPEVVGPILLPDEESLMANEVIIEKRKAK